MMTWVDYVPVVLDYHIIVTVLCWTWCHMIHEITMVRQPSLAMRALCRRHLYKQSILLWWQHKSHSEINSCIVALISIFEMNSQCNFFSLPEISLIVGEVCQFWRSNFSSRLNFFANCGRSLPMLSQVTFRRSRKFHTRIKIWTERKFKCT